MRVCLRGLSKPRGQALNLASRPLHHRLEVNHELPINHVVRGPECIEGRPAGAIENPEHREVLLPVFRRVIHLDDLPAREESKTLCHPAPGIYTGGLLQVEAA